MKVLFVCKANVGRSQMAEAFFNRLSKKNSSKSAGTDVDENNGKTLPDSMVKCMAEKSYDISKCKRKQLTPKMVKEADKIIVLTAKEDMPTYTDFSKVVLWDVEDAKGMPYEFHCRIRDYIKSLVERLVKETG